jgi:hypothetical protein
MKQKAKQREAILQEFSSGHRQGPTFAIHFFNAIPPFGPTRSWGFGEAVLASCSFESMASLVYITGFSGLVCVFPWSQTEEVCLFFRFEEVGCFSRSVQVL